MNSFLNILIETIAIDIDHLNFYLSLSELKYLDDNLRSKNDFDSDFYTDQNGDNLEVLFYFLTCHKDDISRLLADPSKKEILIELYTSSSISGNYDCFRFDLSKFEQTFNPSGQEFILYRVGRANETIENVGNSWAKDFTGLKNYIQASSIEVDNRPIFSIKVSDSEVLCHGQSQESEFILKKNFKCSDIKLLKSEERSKIFI